MTDRTAADLRPGLSAAALITAALVPSVLVAVALAAALDLAMLGGMLWPLSPAGGAAGRWLPITETRQARADRALARRGAPDWDAAERETRAELRIAPMRATPWMRLAYIDAGRHRGALTAAGLSALQRAYEFSPFDRDVGVWRLQFVYEHWGQATPEIRRAALDETAALWAFASRRAQLIAMPAQVGDPAGRMAITFAVANLNAGAEP